MKYLVEALDTYEKNKIEDKELKRVPKAREQWIVTQERLNALTGTNSAKLVFVKLVEEIKDGDAIITNEEEPKEEKEIEKPVAKRTTVRATRKIK